MKKLSACSEVPFYALFSAKSRLSYFLNAPRPPPSFVFSKNCFKKAVLPVYEYLFCIH
jgi:hypothetical protein